MKKLYLSLSTSSTIVGLVLASVCALQEAQAQTNYYFDQNGPTAGFGLVTNTTYDWDTSASVWNTRSDGAGTVANIFSWSNGNSAYFATGSPSNYTYGINLKNDITVQDFVLNGPATLTVSAVSAQKIHFASGGSIISAAGATSRPLIFDDNIELVGDFKVGGSYVDGGPVGSPIYYEGTGPKYDGTITISGGALGVRNTATYQTRFGEDTKIVLNKNGILYISTNAGSDFIFKELSGTGGTVYLWGATTMGVKQDTNTEWAGIIGSESGNKFARFLKDGTGVLSMTREGGQVLSYKIDVTNGSLYIKGGLSVNTNGHYLTVKDSGNYGGTGTIVKAVILSAATSQFSPGMIDIGTLQQQVGEINLANGLTATNGGTFLFAMNGVDENNDLLNSHLRLSLGSLSFGGNAVFTIKLTDLGLGHIQMNTAYTLFSADSIDLTNFMSKWQLDESTLPVSWGTGDFSLANNNHEIQITFSGVIPEPSSVVLMTVALVFGGMYWMRRRRGSI